MPKRPYISIHLSIYISVPIILIVYIYYARQYGLYLLMAFLTGAQNTAQIEKCTEALTLCLENAQTDKCTKTVQEAILYRGQEGQFEARSRAPCSGYEPNFEYHGSYETETRKTS